MPSVILERPTIDGYAIDRNSAFNRPAYWYVRGADGFPTADAAAADPNPLVRVKLFDPQGRWSWYLAGYDPATRIAFGAVDGWEFEIGDIWMPGLTPLRGKPFALPLERDLGFTPCRLSSLTRRKSRLR